MNLESDKTAESLKAETDLISETGSGSENAVSDFQEESAEEALPLSAAGFPQFPLISTLLSDTAAPVFNDPSYYKNALTHGGDEAKRLHDIYQKYMGAADQKDKTVFRQQIINIYWDYCAKIAREATGAICEPKKFLLRYALLNPETLNPETRDFFSKIIDGPSPESAVYYIDEWLRSIGRNEIKASSTDEVRSDRNDNSAHFRTLIEKLDGKLEGTQGMLRNLNIKRKENEGILKSRISFITGHSPHPQFAEIDNCYADEQKKALVEVQEILKDLSRFDREISNLVNIYTENKAASASVKEKLEKLQAAESVSVDLQALNTEFNSIRQMAKMTIGKMGNSFPMLSGEYFHRAPNDVCYRENVIRKLAWVESIDNEVFLRKYKNQINRIVPFVLLLPTYGDYGVCWEPFDRMNKLTSRGRIAVPLYPKNITIAILTAIGDYRWQFAKEVASFYWMEEGLTGNYYQWFQSQKIKGDVKLYFIQDYISWMTKEAEGIQKLDKEVRGIFWRYMPFAQNLKDKLKDRNLIYQDLYQRDKNRVMSDGY